MAQRQPDHGEVHPSVRMAHESCTRGALLTGSTTQESAFPPQFTIT